MTTYALRADQIDGRLCGACCEVRDGLMCLLYVTRLDVSWWGPKHPFRCLTCMEWHGYKKGLLAEHTFDQVGCGE